MDPPISKRQRQSVAEAGGSGIAKGSAADGVLPGLQLCVKQLEASVGNAFTRMSTSLEQSVGMMNSMNSMMEEYVMRSIEIDGEVSWDGEKCTLMGTVGNASKFVLSGIEIKVCLEGDEAALFKHTVKQIQGRKDVTFEGEIPCQEKSFNVLVVVSFPSPGTGETLKVNKSLRVRLADQCSIKVCKAKESKGEVVHDIDAGLFRQYAKLDPLVGIGLDLSLEVKPFNITLKVIKISEAGELDIAVEGDDQDIKALFASELASISPSKKKT
mmetsp:Transcript_11731/g.19121  ORF Transcript_11731/g.19121 Transcript_11731/m.19121 type:complete len:270 (-) Transcript_11731:17-826(-)